MSKMTNLPAASIANLKALGFTDFATTYSSDAYEVESAYGFAGKSWDGYRGVHLLIESLDLLRQSPVLAGTTYTGTDTLLVEAEANLERVATYLNSKHLPRKYVGPALTLHYLSRVLVRETAFDTVLELLDVWERSGRERNDVRRLLSINLHPRDIIRLAKAERFQGVPSSMMFELFPDRQAIRAVLKTAG